MSKSNIFTKIQVKVPQTSSFDLSHDVKLTLNMGRLVPIMAQEVLPGDRWKLRQETLLRFQPLIAPVMHKVNVSTQWYFVPNRILWPNWNKFLEAVNPDGGPVHPFSSMANIPTGGLGDYLGYPTEMTNYNSEPLKVSPFPVAAYYKIWDEYYRDQNLQTEKFVELEDGENPHYADVLAFNLPEKRAWMHDYFTACLPFAQKGDAVLIPLVTEEGIPVMASTTGNSSPGAYRKIADGSLFPASGEAPARSLDGSQVVVSSGEGTSFTYYDPRGSLTVDVNATATDINSLRRAFRLQEWLELNARGGTRIRELIKTNFNVITSDARLQIPELIGSFKQNMVISEVLSTAQTEGTELGDQVVGQMAGHGISAGSGRPITYRSEEHGWIIGILNVQPLTAYQQGVPKQLTRFSKLDYAWPTFAHLGEQAVLNKEVFGNLPDNDTQDGRDGVFGYMPIYGEYRYINSRVAGDMKNSLNFWHFGRIFENKPSLNSDFIECDPRKDAFAVTSDEEHELIGHILLDVWANRRLPKYGTPTL